MGWEEGEKTSVGRTAGFAMGLLEIPEAAGRLTKNRSFGSCPPRRFEKSEPQNSFIIAHVHSVMYSLACSAIQARRVKSKSADPTA